MDYLELIWPAVEAKIQNERLTYSKVYETVEEYLSRYTSGRNSIVAGSDIAIDLLLGKDRDLDDFVYELYTENPFFHANGIANVVEASKKTLPDHDPEDPDSGFGIVFLKNTIPNTKYQIIVDARPMITIFRLSEGSINIISPIKTKTFDKKHDILVIPPEILLSDVYRTLYLPDKAGDWEDALYAESKLFNLLKKRLSDKIGSAEPILSHDDRRKIEFKLLEHFVVNNPNIVLIGEHALKMLVDTEVSTPIIQIISQNSIEDDFAEISKLIRLVTNTLTPVLKMTRDIHIMQDYRIRRTTIKAGANGREIMYIYNSAAYDLIPFNRMTDPAGKEIRIGNPFVLLRFLLIDIWMILWVRGLGSIDEKFARLRYENILSEIIKLRTLMMGEAPAGKKHRRRNAVDHLSINPELVDAHEAKGLRIFPSSSDDYIGVYDDEAISQKLLVKNLSTKYYDYFPFKYFRDFGTYRDLGQKS